MADRAQLVLPPVGLPGAARALLRGASRLRAAGVPPQRDARLHPPGARGLLDQPRADAATGASRSRSPRTARPPQREDGWWDPEAGTIYVWYDALINYITGAGFPDDPDAFAHVVAGRPPRHRQGHRPVPHDLLAGDAVERRPRGAAPGLGPRLSCRAGREDEQEPRQLPRPRRGGRRVRRRRRALRDAPRGPVRPGRRRVVGLVRAALQRRPRERLRQPREPHGLDGQPLPRRRAAGAAPAGESPLGRGLGGHAARGTASGSTAACCTTRWRELWEFVRRREQDRRRRAALDARQGGEGGRRGGRRAAPRRAGRPRRGVPAGRARCRAVHAGHRAADPGAARARLPLRPDGNGGPPILAELQWAAHAGDAGRVTAPEPLFPRLDVEVPETTA